MSYFPARITKNIVILSIHTIRISRPFRTCITCNSCNSYRLIHVIRTVHHSVYSVLSEHVYGSLYSHYNQIISTDFVSFRKML